MSEFKAGDICVREECACSGWSQQTLKIEDSGDELYGVDSSGQPRVLGPKIRPATAQEIDKWYSDRYDHRKEEADRLQTAVYRAHKLTKKAYDEWMYYEEQQKGTQ